MIWKVMKVLCASSVKDDAGENLKDFVAMLEELTHNEFPVCGVLPRLAFRRYRRRNHRLFRSAQGTIT